MADAYDEPLSATELEALPAGHSLLRKVARVLVTVAGQARIADPALGWPDDEDDVLRDVARQFRTHGQMTTFTHARLRAGISVGAYAERGETWLGVVVWNNPKSTDVRKQIVERADHGHLPAAWERSRVGWRGLETYRRLSECVSATTAGPWLTSRLEELRLAGIMGLLPVLGASLDPETTT